MPMGNVGESHLFFPGFDKLVHCGMFFVFTVFAANAHIRAKGNISIGMGLLLFLIAVAFGGIIELLQLYIFTWRDGDWADLFADSVGAGMATFCILVINSASKYDQA